MMIECVLTTVGVPQTILEVSAFIQKMFPPAQAEIPLQILQESKSEEELEISQNTQVDSTQEASQKKRRGRKS